MKIEDHIGLAKSIAYQYSQRIGVDFDDLYSYALEGLSKAVSRFDPDKGYKFSSYAVPYIRGSINRYYRDRSCVPRGIQELYFKGNKLAKKGYSAKEICESLKIDFQEWESCCLLMKFYYYRLNDIEIGLNKNVLAQKSSYVPDFQCLIEKVVASGKIRVYKRLSEVDKQRIVYLREKRYFSFKRIAKEVNCSWRCAYYIYRKLLANSDFSSKLH